MIPYVEVIGKYTLKSFAVVEPSQCWFELSYYDIGEFEVYASATLNNLLAIPKFNLLVESFEVGNWIRVQVDDRVYKLRLVEYEISYGDFDSISVKFSDVAKIKN